MNDPRLTALESFLRLHGAQTAAAIAAELDVSQPTVSRLLRTAGERVVRIGRARASRYALAHGIARRGSHWPLYRMDADARPHRLGELHALHDGAFYFESSEDRPALLYGEFAAGLFPGLPWFLDDQRPQGFLGRAFAHRVAADIDAPEDPLLWRSDDVVLALLRHGDDQPGDLLLGEAALRRALDDILMPREGIAVEACEIRYPQLAEAALRGEDVGSSAGGEQPKFAVSVQRDGECIPVIVKFSDRIGTPNGRRWADLLICEHHACEVLHEHGLPAARSVLIEADARVFLQSSRFDRTPSRGRRGLVSLMALDAACYGHGRIDWWRFAAQLQADGWLSAADARHLRLFGWYGALIANSDMHLGNVSLQLRDRRPLPLAPAYDMLPMRFRPSVSGEIVARRYEIRLPPPEFGEDWQQAAQMALAFWRRAGEDARVSADLRAIADDAGQAITRTLAYGFT